MDERGSNLYQKQYFRDALDHKVEFYNHNISKEDKLKVLGVLDSIFLTTGDVTLEFETAFAKYLNSKFSVGLMSCTHALELALRYFDIGDGDEVITTPMSFVATANAIEYVGAKPIFVDVNPETGNIDVEAIEHAITNKTKAIIPVHLYGQMCDMKRITMIAKKYHLKVIEDSAHCIEGVRDGIQPGQLGDAACFSFYATKNITSGEGGAISCNDPEMYNWLLRARQHGITKDAARRYTKKYEHYDQTFLGMKCNMSNIQAALLLDQVNRIENVWTEKKAIVDEYDQLLAKVSKPTTISRSAHHLYTVWTDGGKRDAILHRLQEHGIGVAVNYKPIHLMSFYRKKYNFEVGDFPIAERIGESTISIPLYSKLTSEEIHYISHKVIDLFGARSHE